MWSGKKTVSLPRALKANGEVRFTENEWIQRVAVEKSTFSNCNWYKNMRKWIFFFFARSKRNVVKIIWTFETQRHFWMSSHSTFSLKKGLPNVWNIKRTNNFAWFVIKCGLTYKSTVKKNCNFGFISKCECFMVGVLLRTREHLKYFCAIIVKVGILKTDIGAPQSKRKRICFLDGVEVSLCGFDM